jgi:hypothetical protein
MADDVERELSGKYGIASVLVVLGAGIIYSLIRPIPPLRGRQGVLLHDLRTIAENVNAYRSEHRRLPERKMGISATITVSLVPRQ